jgi:hypothetical protein
MPQANVEIMRAALDAFNRRDGKAFGALLDKGRRDRACASGPGRRNVPRR